MAASKKKTKIYLMIGGGVGLLLLLFLFRRSDGSATPVATGGVTSPVVMGTNPSYDGAYGSGSQSSQTAPATDYTVQLNAVGQTLSQLSAQLANAIQNKTKNSAQTPDQQKASGVYTAPTTIPVIQSEFQRYGAANPGKNMSNDTYLSSLHEQANTIRLTQIAQLQNNFQEYVKTHPGATMKDTPYLASLHEQADKLRGQLAGG